MAEQIKQRETINVILCGHVDAGKSTIGGQLMRLTGSIEERTFDKYRMEAKEQSGESWFLSWSLDSDPEERRRGKTIDVGKGFFQSSNKNCFILDAPGHLNFIPNMIGGAVQADLAILVISARLNEFERGFQRSGQTREHLILLKAVGVEHLIVLVNKMDDPTVSWSQDRFQMISNKLMVLIKKIGFNSDQVHWMPCSGLNGTLLKEKSEASCPSSWYSGPTLIEYIDKLPSFDRFVDKDFRMIVSEQFRDTKTNLIGKVLSGKCRIGDRCSFFPSGIQTEIGSIYFDEQSTNDAQSGDMIRLVLKDSIDEDLLRGSILCRVGQTSIPLGRLFEAQIVVLDEEKLITVGYKSMLHIHSTTAQIRISRFLGLVDRRTGSKSSIRRHFLQPSDLALVQIELVQPEQRIPVEVYENFPLLGRFILRDGNSTVALGKITKIVN